MYNISNPFSLSLAAPRWLPPYRPFPDFEKIFVGKGDRRRGGGQVLVYVAGKGICAEYGKDPVLLTPGKIIFIPANVKHFHGAVKNEWFSHVAVELPGKGTSSEWLEEVDEKTYDLLLQKLEK